MGSRVGERLGPGSRRRWVWILAVVVVLGLLAVLLFPWGVSAYYVERAGRYLDAEHPTASTTEAAEQAVLRALKWTPDNAQACRLLAQVYAQQGDQLARLEALAHFVTLRPLDPLGAWELARACEQLPASDLVMVPGQPCGIDETGRQAILVHLWRRSGHTADSFAEAGEALREIGKLPEAEAFYKRALLLDPGSVAAWQGLTQMVETRDGAEAALEYYANLIATNESAEVVAFAHHGRGQVLAEARQWVEASLEFGQAVTLAPDQGKYHLDYGWALFWAGGEAEEIRTELSRAASLLPGNPWPFVHLSHAAYAAQDYAAALEYARQAIALSPDLSGAWMREGMALRALGRLAESEQSLRQAVRLGSDQAPAHAELGTTLSQQDKVEEAIQEFEWAVSLAPNNVQHSLSLANAFRQNGQVTRAAETYRRVLELDPGNDAAQEALRDLGY